MAITDYRTANANNTTTAAFQTTELLLLISITSGPSHSHLRLAARETWLIPCIHSSECDYVFFVDRHEANITESLIVENKTFGDLVFRGSWCPFMLERHHHRINYGNFMDADGEGDNTTVHTKLPEYQLRGMYKIDWKVCFTKWALQNHKMAAYHAYVEDDSFTCVDNLLHQLRLLTALQRNGTKVPSIRAGTPMYDGFDDSSTLMSRDIAMVFATLYPSVGFNCSKMADAVDRQARDWLSWGNSWMNSRCGWRNQLKALGVSMVVPQLHKTGLLCEDVPSPVPAAAPSAKPSTAPLAAPSSVASSRRMLLGGRDTYAVINLVHGGIHDDNQTLFGSRVDDDTPKDAPRLSPHSRRLYVALPCPKVGGAIIHHYAAGEKLLAEPFVAHMCEYTLFIDKIKNDSRLRALWSSVGQLTHPMYHDFSPVLTREAEQGWPVVVQKIEATQRACGMNATGTGIGVGGGGTGGAGGTGGSGRGNASVEEAACQAWRRRRLESTRVIRGTALTAATGTSPGGKLVWEVGIRDYFGGWMAAHGL